MGDYRKEEEYCFDAVVGFGSGEEVGEFLVADRMAYYEVLKLVEQRRNGELL